VSTGTQLPASHLPYQKALQLIALPWPTLVKEQEPVEVLLVTMETNAARAQPPDQVVSIQKYPVLHECWWLRPVIPATQEAEIRRIEV
jgi:hypothetical protein